MKFGTSFDIAANVILHDNLGAVRDDRSADTSIAFEHSQHDSLTSFLIFLLKANSPALVHIANLPADEGFIDFDLAVKHSAGQFILHGEPNSVPHEPRGFLSDAKSSMELPGAIPVLAIGNHPGCGEPLVQRDRRVLKDCPNLHGELPPGMLGRALPAPMLRLIMHLGATAGRADNAVRPTTRNKIVNAVLRVGK